MRICSHLELVGTRDSTGQFVIQAMDALENQHAAWCELLQDALPPAYDTHSTASLVPLTSAAHSGCWRLSAQAQRYAADRVG
jgi:hypothetical protein